MNSQKIMILPSSKSLQSVKGRRSIEPSRKMPIKVALVEDQPKVRASWTKFINSFPDFTCICACATGEEALRVIPQEQPDVILMDLFLPRMSGIECTVRLKELLPQTQIIILTAMDDEELVFLALEAGADGYLLKRTKPSDLRTALLDVLGGGAP
ncbi:MAG TPA: DNA-binding response regulator, partial [Verrucomicrobia subdivision 3 bacterium]|nr:DNA-binding response regulator [Limisphaerales bacterium]